MSEDSNGKVPMRPGFNGGGALQSGNPKAKGTMPSQIRQKLRGSFVERIPILEHIADGFIDIREICPKCKYEPPDRRFNYRVATNDVLRAIDIMAKHGMATTMPLDEVRDKLKMTLGIAGGFFVDDPEKAQEFVNALRQVWIGDS